MTKSMTTPSRVQHFFLYTDAFNTNYLQHGMTGKYDKILSKQKANTFQCSSMESIMALARHVIVAIGAVSQKPRRKPSFPNFLPVLGDLVAWDGLTSFLSSSN